MMQLRRDEEARWTSLGIPLKPSHGNQLHKVSRRRLANSKLFLYCAFKNSTAHPSRNGVEAALDSSNYAVRYNLLPASARKLVRRRLESSQGSSGQWELPGQRACLASKLK